MKAVVRFYYCVIYYVSWLGFGVAGLILNLGCAVLLPLPRTPRLQRGTRRVIQALFALWIRWLHATGVVRIRWVGFPAQLPEGTVYVANHPTLVDATFLLTRIPNAFCIFKPALMHHPCIAPAAILSGYVSSGRPVDTLREACAAVAAGSSLLVFPEGTRTNPGECLGPFKPGFALAAIRAGAPIQALRLSSTPGLVTRGSPWWPPPAVLPGALEITLGRNWSTTSPCKPAELAAEIERYFRDQLPHPVA